MITVKLAKRFLTEYKIFILIVTILTLCWKLGFLDDFEYDWEQFSFEKSKLKDEPKDRWKHSPLWVEDQKPHINPHRYRFVDFNQIIINEITFFD